jgi:hypothetical protein
MSLYAKRLEKGRFISYGLCQPHLDVRKQPLELSDKLKIVIDPRG